MTQKQAVGVGDYVVVQRRLCQAAVLAKEAVAIFGPTVAKQRVPPRIEDLLGCAKHHRSLDRP